jgi:hypothetical protein
MNDERELLRIHIVDEVRDAGERLSIGVRKVTPKSDCISTVMVVAIVIVVSVCGNLLYYANNGKHKNNGKHESAVQSKDGSKLLHWFLLCAVVDGSWINLLLAY